MSDAQDRRATCGVAGSAVTSLPRGRLSRPVSSANVTAASQPDALDNEIICPQLHAVQPIEGYSNDGQNLVSYVFSVCGQSAILAHVLIGESMIHPGYKGLKSGED